MMSFLLVINEMIVHQSMKCWYMSLMYLSATLFHCCSKMDAATHTPVMLMNVHCCYYKLMANFLAAPKCLRGDVTDV